MSNNLDYLLNPDEISALLNKPSSNENEIDITSYSVQKHKTLESANSIFKSISQDIAKTFNGKVQVLLEQATIISNYCSTPQSFISYLYCNNQKIGTIEIDNNSTGILLNFLLGSKQAKKSDTGVSGRIGQAVLGNFCNLVGKIIRDNLDNSIHNNQNTNSENVATPACLFQIQMNANNQTAKLKLAISYQMIASIINQKTSIYHQSNQPEKLLDKAKSSKTSLTAILKSMTCQMSDVAKWKKGDIISLHINKDDAIYLNCNQQNLAQAITGRKGNHILVKIIKKV